MTFLYWPVDKVNYIDCFLNIEPTLLHFQDKPHLVMIFFKYIARFNLLKLFLCL